MTTHIYSGPLSMFGAKVEIAAREKGVPFELVMVPFTIDDAYEPKHPEVLRVNPVKQQVPVLTDDIDGGVALFDSTQISEYLEDRYPGPESLALWPAGIAERARARQLEQKSDEVFFPNVIRLFGLQHDMKSAPAVAACAACARFYEELEGLLASRECEYLAGPYSFADIAFYMAHVFADRKGAGMTGATPRLVAWRDRVGARPAVRAVVDPMMRFLASQGRGVPAFLQR
ncbi:MULTISPECIES: glutathione S-transferase family protein [unclassified Variovorax]|uniref:glutathione S-transferase family protein n=1 Tax=unclassified Variovorax TaxID=663243 RepID=UPI0008BE3C70|nr:MULTISPECIES: glutathione S-transferase family protein [unclassified Variovorax]SEJ28539.1 glutathione S-transferase [Variovorax sp. OK202]SFC21868.1 glutathione S-transferase [Variovorax sp. OK212]